MRNIRSIYLACTNVCNLVIVFATLFYLFFALFYCYSLSGVQLKELGLSQTVVEFFLLQIKIRVLVQDVQYICSKDFILDSLKNCFLIIPSVTMIFFGIMFSIVQQIPLMLRTYKYLTFLQSHSFHFNVRESIHQMLPLLLRFFGRTKTHTNLN